GRSCTGPHHPFCTPSAWSSASLPAPPAGTGAAGGRNRIVAPLPGSLPAETPPLIAPTGYFPTWVALLPFASRAHGPGRAAPGRVRFTSAVSRGGAEGWRARKRRRTPLVPPGWSPEAG